MDFLNVARDLAVLATELEPLPRRTRDAKRISGTCPANRKPGGDVGGWWGGGVVGGGGVDGRLDPPAEAWPRGSGAEASKVQLRELVKKLIPESIGKEIEKQCQGIFPLKDEFGWGGHGREDLEEAQVRHHQTHGTPWRWRRRGANPPQQTGNFGDDAGVEMMRPEADDAMNTLTADVVAAGAE
eukprot:Skav225096  [mRNA]  locus=scaffold621:318937:326954:- [translate_table: standard]